VRSAGLGRAGDSTHSARPSAVIDGPFLLDGHVHLHPCFDEDGFFDAAARSIRAAAHDQRFDHAIGILMFAECHDADRFRRLARSNVSSGGGWRFRATDEEISLIAERDDDALLLVAGRQVRTAERLEVLALGTDRDLPDGLPLLETLRASNEAGALAVIPWGFGKWWLGRGRLMSRTLLHETVRGVFIGDNGNRPGSPLRPRLLALADELAIPILPGSDPLPLSDHLRRVGTNGAVLRIAGLTADRPAFDLKERLRSRSVELSSYGARRGFGGFVRDQARLRARRIRSVDGRSEIR